LIRFAPHDNVRSRRPPKPDANLRPRVPDVVCQ
jgi:hypothetical protein